MSPGPALILWIFFWMVMIMTILYGIGLLYHWIRYGSLYPLALIMMPVYVVGALVFIGAMLAGINAV
mgnify:CR=1 FL=1